MEAIEIRAKHNDSTNNSFRKANKYDKPTLGLQAKRKDR